MVIKAVGEYSGATLELNTGCCGESGMGSVTSPEIYNILRSRKQENLARAMGDNYKDIVLVGCPSCKIGVARCFLNMKRKNHVVHIAEFLAGLIDGEDRRQTFRRLVGETKGELRVINMNEVRSGTEK